MFNLLFEKSRTVRAQSVRAVVHSQPSRFNFPLLQPANGFATLPDDMTLTEKILARAAGKQHVQAGDNVWVSADILMTHDVCGPGTIGVFKREFGNNARVWDRQKVVIMHDHYILTADSKSNRNVDLFREFVKEQHLPYF